MLDKNQISGIIDFAKAYPVISAIYLFGSHASGHGGIIKNFILSMIFILSGVFVFNGAVFAEAGFTQKDRERLIRLEVTLQEFKPYVDKRFEQIDKRFEQIDKRFEQVNKRFEDIITFMGILAAVFTAMMIGTIGFAYWDRRTMVRKAKEDTISEIEKVGSLKNLIMSLRELAKNDSELANVLRQFNLL